MYYTGAVTALQPLKTLSDLEVGAVTKPLQSRYRELHKARTLARAICHNSRADPFTTLRFHFQGLSNERSISRMRAWRQS